MGWDILEDFSKAFTKFYLNKLNDDERTIYLNHFKPNLDDFKTIFQINKL